jgi:tyrosine-protein kinase Etk/Wzc
MIAQEAYQTLQTTIRFELPPDRQRVLLVTSAVEGEGKSHVAAGLARALARADQKTLLVSADLRFPTLHTLFETDRSPGLAELLRAGRDGASSEAWTREFAAALRSSQDAGVALPPNLDFLPSGSRAANPSALLFSDAVEHFFAAVALRAYDYVVVDGAPLLGIADSRSLAKRADSVLIVSRPERSTVDDVAELRDVLDRLGAHALGIVVVGVRRAGSYAYVGADLTAEDVEAGRVLA